MKGGSFDFEEMVEDCRGRFQTRSEICFECFRPGWIYSDVSGIQLCFNLEELQFHREYRVDLDQYLIVAVEVYRSSAGLCGIHHQGRDVARVIGGSIWFFQAI